MMSFAPYRSRIAWTVWALLPVFGLTYHYGPGQRWYNEGRASVLLGAADLKLAAAEKAQGEAYEHHLAAFEARRAAFVSQLETDGVKAKQAGEVEDASYAKAAAAWKQTAEAYQKVQDVLEETSPGKVQEVRFARDRALIRAGDIAAGVNDLEELLESLPEDDASAGGDELAARTREELATGYYYGARLMRLAGKSPSEWREVSGKARQNFRYLAESARDAGADEKKVADLQHNLELVLNLEQSSLDDLQAKPLPKNSPRGNANGLGKKPAKGKGKRRGDDRSEGAGDSGPVGAGW